MFPPVPPNKPFIQIMHADGSHWLTVSNIDINNHSQFSDAVMIYDSGYPVAVSLAIKKAICSIMQPKAPKLHFDIVNVMSQTNGPSCNATELMSGFDPVLCYWDTDVMGPHLLSCLERAHLSRFPTRRIP